MIAARCLGSNRIRLDAVGSRRFERAMCVLVAIDRTEIPRLSSIRSVLPETGTVAARAAREAIGRRRLHQDQNSRTEPYLLGAVASMRARTVGAPCEAYPVPEAVIFDLDGVLLDSEQLWNRAKEQLTRCSGGRWHEDAPTVMLGMSSPEWARYLHDELAVPLDPQEINRQVVRHMQELYREQLPLLPGALDVVRALRQRWPLGLASSANREIIELFLELGELAGTFAATVSSEEVAQGKPAPDVYSRRSREDGRRSCEVSRSRGLQQRAASRHRGGHDSDRGAQSALSAHR
jgi:phosphoglycolate phosphatase-like HAD superfamily hydrolase